MWHCCKITGQLITRGEREYNGYIGGSQHTMSCAAFCFHGSIINCRLSSHTYVLSSHTYVLSSYTYVLSSHTHVLSSHIYVLSSHTCFVVTHMFCRHTCFVVTHVLSSHICFVVIHICFVVTHMFCRHTHMFCRHTYVLTSHMFCRRTHVLSSYTCFVVTHICFVVIHTCFVVTHICFVFTHICDTVCQWLAAGLWFSPGTPVSSINKTYLHDITEILLTVALKTIIPSRPSICFVVTHIGYQFSNGRISQAESNKSQSLPWGI
jgi:hypothetical protein